MRRSSIFILTAAMAAGLFMSSCKKNFIEKLPPTSLTPEQALATEADLQVALRGAYIGLRGTSYYGALVPLIGDLMADNAYQSITNTNRYPEFDQYNFTKLNGNILNIWTAIYADILRANNIINAEPTVVNQSNVDQYKGEAYAIRALNYFNLVRLFARPYTDNPAGPGVPLVLQYDPAAKPARNTVQEVYTQIIDDLNKAYTLMTKFTNSSQFSKYAAKALQAKVYLTMGDKTNAKAAALDVINNSGFTLLTQANYLSFWNTLTPRTDKVETLFETSQDATNNSGFEGLANLYNQSGYGDFLVTTDLYNSYAAGDVRKGLYTVGTKGGNPAIFVNNKFPGTYGSEISDPKILRLSEMYLIAAEASLPTNEADALTYVNYLTSRRGAPAIASTGAQLFDDIIAERRRELAFDGDRYFDLQRLKSDIVRNNINPSSAHAVAYTNIRRVFPIPETERNANANVTQNPGY